MAKPARCSFSRCKPTPSALQPGSLREATRSLVVSTTATLPGCEYRRFRILMTPPLELYPFRFRDPRTGKWVRARYRATLAEIKARYREWEIDGPAEIRGD